MSINYKNSLFVFLVLTLVTRCLSAQPCTSIGKDGQEISITQNGSSTSYTGLAFELQLSSEGMVKFEVLLPKYLFKYTNQYCQEHGLPQLTWVKAYEQAAFNQCNYLLTESDRQNAYVIGHGQDNPSNKYFSGSRASARAAYYSGKQEYCGENCLYTWVKKEEFDEQNIESVVAKLAYQMVFEQWHNSPGHRENMLKPSYKTLGCAGTIRSKITKDRFLDCDGKVQEYVNSDSWLMLYAAQVFGLE